MDFLQRMQQNTPYCSRHTDMPTRLQQKAKTLCWQYNQTDRTSSRSVRSCCRSCWAAATR